MCVIIPYLPSDTDEERSLGLCPAVNLDYCSGYGKNYIADYGLRRNE